MSKNEMITLPREVAKQIKQILQEASRSLAKHRSNLSAGECMQAAVVLQEAMEHQQPDTAPYLYYDPNNGDTWTQEAINDGCCPPDGLIALYTKETK